MKKLINLISFMAVLIFSAASASASVISFQIIQHDKSQNEVRDSSYIIENTLFDYFFNKGFVTTNCPTATTDDSSDDMGIFSRSFFSAKIGYCNYFIVLTVDYDVRISKNTKGNFLSNIDSISWQVYDTSTSKVIAEGSKEVGEVSAQRNNDKGIIGFATEIAADIYDEL